MPDIVVNTHELQVKATLRRGETEQTTRTLIVANPKTYTSEQKERMLAFREDLISGSLSNFLQPASWRDDDENSPPWQVVNVEYTDVVTSKTTYDLDYVEPLDIQVEVTPTELSSTDFNQVSTKEFTVTVTGYSSLNELSKTVAGTAPVAITNATFYNTATDGVFRLLLACNSTAVATGTETCSFTITATEGEYSGTATVTITSCNNQISFDL